MDPSLTEMVEKAIQILSKNRKGFFLFVEDEWDFVQYHSSYIQMFHFRSFHILDIVNTNDGDWLMLLLWLTCHLLSFVHQEAELTTLITQGGPREPCTRPSSSTEQLGEQLNSPAS